MRVIILLGALLMTTAPARSAPVEETRLQLVDLTDEYDLVWTETQKLPEAERTTHFRQRFATIIPGFYDPKRLASFGVTPEQYDAFVGKMLTSYPAKRDAIRGTAASFSKQFAPALKSFEAEFGPMAGYPPVYLVNSHNEFDGGTRDLPEGPRLLFGADVIAKLYADKPIQPFFHHELFHLRHLRTFPECPQLWCSLWFEGLAVHVAKSLNPGATDEDLLLTSPAPLRPAVEANKREAVCTVLSRLDSERSEDYAPLFMGGGEPLSTTLPRRFGYYVGLLVAQDLGRTRSLQQLAQLSPAEAKPLIRRSLESMADCGESRGERG